MVLVLSSLSSVCRWTELWLNEGFASFVEHISVEKQFPEWKIWNQFVDDFFSSAMRLDALKRCFSKYPSLVHDEQICDWSSDDFCGE